MTSVRRPDFDSEVERIKKEAELKYGKIKGYEDYKANIPNPVKPWMKVSRNPPKILFSEISCPADQILQVPIHDPTPQYKVTFQVLTNNNRPFCNFYIHTNIPNGKLRTDSEGLASVMVYKGNNLEYACPKTGWIGEGINRIRDESLVPMGAVLKILRPTLIELRPQSGFVKTNNVLQEQNLVYK